MKKIMHAKKLIKYALSTLPKNAENLYFITIAT